MKEKVLYDPPQVEVVEFEVEEAIAQSAWPSGSSWFGTLGSEEIWGE